MIQKLRSKVYYLTSAEPGERNDLIQLVHAVLRAGVGMVQYRAKNRTTAAMVREAGALVRLTRHAQVPFIVNDRVDVALAVGADGVHIGQDDMPAAHARRVLAPYAIVGVTAPEPAQAVAAQRNGATYISCGPVFASPTKPQKPPLGPEAVRRIQNVVSVPVCAIGGINEETIYQFNEVNPALIAVASAINDAADPGQAVHSLVALAEQVIPHIAFGL